MSGSLATPGHIGTLFHAILKVHIHSTVLYAVFILYDSVLTATTVSLLTNHLLM